MSDTDPIRRRDRLTTWADNLSERRSEVTIGAVLAAGLPWLGGASMGLVVASALAVVAWGAAWPSRTLSDDGEGVATTGSEDGTEAADHWGRTASFWRSVLSGFDGPALALDRATRVLAVNGAAEPLLSVPEGNYISIAIRSPSLLAAVERALSTGIQQSFEFSTTVPFERHLEGLATPLTAQERVRSDRGWSDRGRSDRGRSDRPALLLVLKDRTEQQQLAEMRADFVANASHELRTPLAAIRGFVETLQGPAKDDPVARERFLGIMQTQTERMSRLIDDLLSLSRIEMRERVAPTGRVDFAAVVGEAVAGLRGIAEERGITIGVAEPKGEVDLTGDRDELYQVAQNLIQNAIKYGRQGGRVDVSLAQQGDRVALVVSDDGIGIAPEHLPRLTERFYRVSAKDSRERGGTGLGLAIVKHIVNRHRGELRLTSRPGAGTTFTVSLPAGAEPGRVT